MSSYWFLRRSFSSQLAFSPWSPSKGGSPAPKAGLAAILVLLLLAPVILLLPALRPPIGWAFGFAGLVEVCRVHPMRAYSPSRRNLLRQLGGVGCGNPVPHPVLLNPRIMSGILNGPNRAYADAYADVNSHINEISTALADEIRVTGFRSESLAPSERTDKVGIKGGFPHKTAATRAGLGWIGRHCQLITRPFGPWVRLGTVFTDAELPCGTPAEKAFCGRCMICVEACPAKALRGGVWYPGVPREDLLDAKVCDNWKKEHYFQYHGGHVCGICSAVCPHGLKVLRRKSEKI